MRKLSATVVLLSIGTAAAVAPLRGQETDPCEHLLLSPAQEFALGERDREDYLEKHPLSPDGNLVVNVDRVGRRVAEFSGRPDEQYRFLVLQGERPQAISFTGGTLGVTEGLARNWTEDELAFTLGHEMAHIALGHHVEMWQLELKLKCAGFSVEHQDPKAMAVLRSFSQEREMVADQYGALYAVRAEYAYSSGPRALEKLAEGSGADRDPMHPSYTERITVLKEFEAELKRSLAHFEQGKTALMAGRHDEAIGALQRFVAQFPQSAAGQINLGGAYLARVRSDAGTPSNLAETLPVLPEPGVVLRGSYDATDLEKARHHFKLGLASNDSESTAMAGLALVHIRLEEYGKARALLQRALAEGPNRPDLQLSLGNVDYLTGEYEAATIHYNAALGLSAGWPDAEKNLALTYERLERFEDARALWMILSRETKYRALSLRRLNVLEGR